MLPVRWHLTSVNELLEDKTQVRSYFCCRFLKTRVGSNSGPFALDGFSPLSSLITPLLSIWILGMSGQGLSGSWGRTGSSSVNTLSYCSFRMSAFSLGLVNSLPCHFKITIPAESLRLALIYCQKCLVIPALAWSWTGSASSMSNKLFTYYCWCASCSSLCTSLPRCLNLRQTYSLPLRRAVITTLIFTAETSDVCIAPWERSFVFECSLWYELVNGVITVCFKLIPICLNRLCFGTGCFK